MLLRHSLRQEDAARRVERAVEKVLAHGLRTADIAAPGQRVVGTQAMGDAVVSALQVR
jgi:3-isopropylmalate dehydrogenase